jgi:hypothetical protein
VHVYYPCNPRLVDAGHSILPLHPDRIVRMGEGFLQHLAHPLSRQRHGHTMIGHACTMMSAEQLQHEEIDDG